MDAFVVYFAKAGTVARVRRTTSPSLTEFRKRNEKIDVLNAQVRRLLSERRSTSAPTKPAS